MAPRKRIARKRKDAVKCDKVQAFLHDFNIEVQTRIQHMREDLKHILMDVENSYNMALIKLPTNVRKMPWEQYFKSEKPNLPDADAVKSVEEAAAVMVVEEEYNKVLLKSAKKKSNKKVGSKSILEEENSPSAVRKTRAARKQPTTSKRAKALSICKKTTSVRRSTRKPLVTPARSILDYSLVMGPTPLVTPRFDPRLPKTPAVRVPRHKERVFSISVNGSPIAASSEDVVVNVPVGNGESIQLLASQMDSVDLSQLDETALKSLQLLQNRLMNLCSKSK